MALASQFRPGAHGRNGHAPEGPDAIQLGTFYYVGSGDLLPDGTTVAAFQNSWANIGGADKVDARYRIIAGAPNILDASGNIAMYVHKVLEIQGDITGGSPGTTAFTLSKHFWLDYAVPLGMHDDSGVYVPARLLSDGQFQPGTP
jgi:hypothetical protein